MRRGHVTFLYGLAAVSAFIFVTQAGPGLAAEATSTITVVKTAGQPPKAEAYRVRPGDHLWQILRRHLGGGSERRIAYYYRRTLRLNRGLKPNRLVAGQTLLLPPVAHRTKAKRTTAPSVAAGAQGAAPVAGAGGASVAAARVGDALSALYAELGEEAVTQGKQFIPLPDTGQIVLDASKFPLLQVGGSTRFVVDAAGAIPAEVDGLLADAGGLRILRYDPRFGFKGLLGKALIGSGLDVRGAGSLVLPGPVEAEVQSDWMVTKGEEREVICLISSPEQATSPAIARHLASRGVHIIDVLVPEGGQGPVQVIRPEACALPEHSPPQVANGKGEIVSQVLSLLGQGYQRNAQVSVFGNPHARPSGFSLRLYADFGFERGGKRFLVDLVGLSPRWRELLERRGYEVLVLDEGGKEAAASLLRFLGQDYREGYTLLAAKRPEGKGISLKVPGVVVDARGEKFILSDARADDGLACALAEAGFKVIELK